MGTGNGLYDVPLLSWICVALGIAASFILLTKPVWWDRCELATTDTFVV